MRCASRGDLNAFRGSLIYKERSPLTHHHNDSISPLTSFCNCTHEMNYVICFRLVNGTSRISSSSSRDVIHHFIHTVSCHRPRAT